MPSGLGASAAWNAMRPRLRRCPRCGLYYAKSLDRCCWCGDLDEAGLSELKTRIAAERESNRSLGRLFLLVTLILMGFVLVL